MELHGKCISKYTSPHGRYGQSFSDNMTEWLHDKALATTRRIESNFQFRKCASFPPQISKCLSFYWANSNSTSFWGLSAYDFEQTLTVMFSAFAYRKSPAELNLGKKQQLLVPLNIYSICPSPNKVWHPTIQQVSASPYFSGFNPQSFQSAVRGTPSARIFPWRFPGSPCPIATA